MQYARINRETNQMIGRPENLPERFVTAEGATISFFHKLPRATLTSLDWLPVLYDPIPSPETHGYPLSPEIADERFIFRAIPRDIEVLRANALQAINDAAKHVTGSNFPTADGRVYTELLKQDEARKYLKAENPDIADYPILDAIVTATGRLPLEIVNRAMEDLMSWTPKIAQIESCRIAGYLKCQDAKTANEIIEFRNDTLEGLRDL